MELFDGIGSSTAGSIGMHSEASNSPITRTDSPSASTCAHSDTYDHAYSIAYACAHSIAYACAHSVAYACAHYIAKNA